MAIQEIRIYTVSLRYKEPFRIASGASSESHNVVIKMLTDYEVFGWGESSPSQRVTGETARTVLEGLGKIAPRLIGMCPLRIEKNVELMDSLLKGNPAAKAALDMALHDILGKTAGKPVFMLMGGYRKEILTDLTLGIKSPEMMAKDASKAVESGFRALKVKVGVDPTEDVKRIKLIREAVGEEIDMRIDANEGWRSKEAVKILDEMEKFNIQFVEQPVPGEDLEGLAYVRKNSSIPVMADESVHSPADVLRLVEAEAVDLVNIKLMKSGGILKGRKIATVAEAAGMPCMIGCMGESVLGIAAGAHLAAAVKNIQYTDLDSDLLMKDRLVQKGGMTIKDSKRSFPTLDGLGIEAMNQKFLGKPKRIYK